jgi:hypothetical protein
MTSHWRTNPAVLPVYHALGNSSVCSLQHIMRDVVRKYVYTAWHFVAKEPKIVSGGGVEV